MKVLITGGTGFIGTQLAKDLLARGADTPVLFDLQDAPERLRPIRDKVQVVRGDLGNLSHVLNAVQQAKPDVIYHLGGMLSLPSDADPAGAFEANARGTFNVFEATRLFGVRQVILGSTIATYGADIDGAVIDDHTIQRPASFYGITKVMAEHMGRFYQRKYGLDFRGVRYPSIVGPGVKTMAIVQYNAWAIEESAKGNPFTIWVEPDIRSPVLYYRDATRALIELSEAPREAINTGVYLIDGPKPMPSAGELAERIRAALPDARLDFAPDPQVMAILKDMQMPLDDDRARQEWGWNHDYALDEIIDAMITEVRGQNA